MSILFVAVNYEHTNEMHVAWRRALDASGEVTFFGPGYSTEEELKHGLKAKWESGEFDALVLSFELLLYSYTFNGVRGAYYEYRGSISFFPISSSIKYADSIISEIEKLVAIKILYYGFDTMTYFPTEWENKIRGLLDEGFYLLGPGLEFEGRLKKGTLWGSREPTVRYFRMIEKYEKKVISFSVCAVSESDLFIQPLELRQFDSVVPGNLAANYYPQRKRMQDILINAGYNVYSDYKNRGLSYDLNKARIDTHEYQSDEEKEIHGEFGSPYICARFRKEAVLQWREEFNASICSSKTAYADGGTCFQIGRKYIEIPAKSTVMICDDVAGLKEYGFRDMESAVIVTENDVLDKMEYLLSYPDIMQKIADNGRKLVISNHLFRHRVDELFKSVRTIKDGFFSGSEWRAGKYIINSITE